MIHFPCCPTASVLLNYVAAARAVMARDDNRGLTFDVPGVGDCEAAVDGLSDGHDFQKVVCVFK